MGWLAFLRRRFLRERLGRFPEGAPPLLSLPLSAYLRFAGACRMVSTQASLASCRSVLFVCCSDPFPLILGRLQNPNPLPRFGCCFPSLVPLIGIRTEPKKRVHSPADWDWSMARMGNMNVCLGCRQESGILLLPPWLFISDGHGDGLQRGPS
ncbi:uncharacterized protein LY79DRAFT_365990 [Colletotrichum navitas]|uniref:Uncharacterized protein n=1 Tax=Colletotrichum navitas TaxID=681940 RepID=A0AAD8PQT6_9PEZI|nr:uncharacterized protein LY79DRAFT_365990 [Colletotrichum navitas]KAK1574547.1 hypothetical protein LY79DRAFT_365990 [Colletotrichum navitas]